MERLSDLKYKIYTPNFILMNYLVERVEIIFDEIKHYRAVLTNTI